MRWLWFVCLLSITNWTSRMLVDSLCCDKESADSICEEDCISISYITPTRDVAGL